MTGVQTCALPISCLAFGLRSDDASYARLMSDVLRASDRLDDAEQVLVRALELPSTSDALVRELEGDLAAVRAARARAPSAGTDG